MEGLAQAIGLIQKTACEASAVQILDVKDPAFYHVRIGDKIVMIARQAEPRQHRVFDVPSFCAAVEAFADGTAVVWHNHQAIIVTVSDETRRDWVTLDLGESDQLQALRECDMKLMDQRTFCSCLKLRLGVDETFIAQFRKLDWQHKREASGTAARGQDRMGVSISDEVNGVSDLADQLILEIPVYDLAAVAYRYKIDCHIEIDASQSKLAIATKPDQIKLAIDQAQHDIHEMLAKGLNPDTSIFYGSPF